VVKPPGWTGTAVPGEIRMPSQNRQERIMERTWEEKKTKLLAQWIAD
jgi:hypothetical protein